MGCFAISLVERIPGRHEIECLVLLPDEEDTYTGVSFGKVAVNALDGVEPVEIHIVW